ncbi:hypothetical protein ABZ816_12300 [Actinosynnema sp. NPDC047251]|uniref:Uncharacterized protein n=1 Tax=Saccharothrix espanaensis (strain ATCC 51144 / DSM 44229 / JCM 9112 / NBRC 15066 / NRRL 15764) TaxID=1179773 RepID=K0KFR6_SACES|nr:hypothetical protein [Saccharothrix espanaensis]CCH35378.1 hypothetical protein BN6_81610 [Saccharothrix espanaensis DSM 44229]
MTDPDSRPQPAESPRDASADRAEAAPAADPRPGTPADATTGPTAVPHPDPAPEPAPGDTTEPAADATADATASTTEGTTEGTAADTPTDAADAPGRPGAVPPVDPQLLFGNLSLASIEADIDAMMNDKMTELDGMLAGLEELVVRLEGEITSLEVPPDDSPTP